MRPKLVVTYTVPFTVTTQAASSVEATTATGNGNITSLGSGGNCDHRGFVYDTTSRGDPGNVAPGSSSYAHNTDESGTFGTGAFTGSLTGLIPSTTYYVRAWAHNTEGYKYGDEVSFDAADPPVPTGVAATNSLSDKVTVTWTKATGATGYHVYQDDVDVSGLLGDVATYDDTDADPPTVDAGDASASKNHSSHIHLELSGLSFTDGTTHTYKVTSVVSGVESAKSTGADGYRKAFGDYSFQWQRSAGNSDADYSNISGGTTQIYNDYAAPYLAGRYYKCVVSIPGAASANSTVARGFRRSTESPVNVVLISIKDPDFATLAFVDGINTSINYQVNLLPSCSFILPMDSPALSYITQLNEAWVYRDGALFDIFPISGKTKSRANGRTLLEVDCLGLGYYLTLDVIPSPGYSQTKTVTNILTDLLAYQGTARITLGGVSASLDTSIAFTFSGGDIWAACKAVRAVVGGYLFVAYDDADPTVRELWLLDSIGESKGQQIRLGKNLTGIQHITDYLETCNRLYPVGNSALNIEKVYTRVDTDITTDANYAYMKLREQYGAYKSFTGVGNALPGTVTVEKPTGAWVSPTGTGSYGDWQDPGNARDGNEATFARWMPFTAGDSQPDYNPTAWLELTIGATTTTQVMVPTYWTADNPDYGIRYPCTLDIEIYYSGAWHSIASGAYYDDVQGTLRVFSFSQQTITGIRVKYRNNANTNAWWTRVDVKEIYIWNGSAYVNDNAHWVQGADEKTLRCAIANYTAGIGYVLSYTHAAYLIDLDDITGREEIITKEMSFDTANQNTLLAMGRTELAARPKLLSPATSISANSIDLSGEEGMEFEDMQLGSTISVIDEEMDIDQSVQIIKITRPDLSQRGLITLEFNTAVKDILDLI